MSSLYLNGKYWYIKSCNQRKATGYTAPLTEKEVRQKIDSLPSDSLIRLMFFDKLEGVSANKNPDRILVKDGIMQYVKIFNGLSDDGTKIIDANQERNYRRVYRFIYEIKIGGQFANRFLSELTDEVIFLWVKELKAEVKPTTIRGYLYCLNRFLNYAVTKKWIASNPINVETSLVFQELNGKKSRNIYKHQGMVRELSKQQQKDLLSAAKFVGEEFYLYVLAALVTGARQREILTLQVRHVDTVNNGFIVEIENAKVREERTVTYCWNPELVALFRKVCKDKQPDEKLFNLGIFSLYRTFKRICKKVGIVGNFSARDLRHVAIIAMMKAGLSPLLIAKQCGTSVALLEKTYTLESQSSIDEEFRTRFANGGL